MPDERTPGAAGQGGTEEADRQDQPDFEQIKRSYDELRPAYTQATQRLSEYEQLFAALHDPDPEVQSYAMAALGLEPAEDTGGAQVASADDEEFADPLEQEVQELRDIVAELRDRAELEADREVEAETLDLRDDYIGQALDYIEQSTGRKFTEQEDEILGNLAIAMADKDDVPDVQGAYQRLYGDDGFLESQRQSWIESKQNAHAAPPISALPADRRPKTAAERVQYVDRRWQELADQQ